MNMELVTRKKVMKRLKKKNEKVDSDYEPKEDESDNDKDKIDHQSVENFKQEMSDGEPLECFGDQMKIYELTHDEDQRVRMYGK